MLLFSVMVGRKVLFSVTVGRSFYPGRQDAEADLADQAVSPDALDILTGSFGSSVAGILLRLRLARRGFP